MGTRNSHGHPTDPCEDTVTTVYTLTHTEETALCALCLPHHSNSQTDSLFHVWTCVCLETSWDTDVRIAREEAYTTVASAVRAPVRILQERHWNPHVHP